MPALLAALAAALQRKHAALRERRQRTSFDFAQALVEQPLSRIVGVRAFAAFLAGDLKANPESSSSSLLFPQEKMFFSHLNIRGSWRYS